MRIKRFLVFLLAVCLLCGLCACGSGEQTSETNTPPAEEQTVPTTAQNTEMIGAVVEVLSAESWKTVMPTFYDTVMDSKIANDEGTVRMLDTIFDNRVIDFAYLYDGWNGWVFKMQSLLVGNQDFASFYAKQEKSVSKHYQKVLDIFLNDLD